MFFRRMLIAAGILYVLVIGCVLWPAHEARHMVRTTISATAMDGVESMRPPPRLAAE